jgi:hypothetical protein
MGTGARNWKMHPLAYGNCQEILQEMCGRKLGAMTAVWLRGGPQEDLLASQGKEGA